MFQVKGGVLYGVLHPIEFNMSGPLAGRTCARPPVTPEACLRHDGGRMPSGRGRVNPIRCNAP